MGKAIARSEEVTRLQSLRGSANFQIPLAFGGFLTEAVDRLCGLIDNTTLNQPWTLKN